MKVIGQNTYGIGIAPFLPVVDSGCIHDVSSDLLDMCGVLHDYSPRIGLYSLVLERKSSPSMYPADSIGYSYRNCMEFSVRFRELDNAIRYNSITFTFVIANSDEDSITSSRVGTWMICFLMD